MRAPISRQRSFRLVLVLATLALLLAVPLEAAAAPAQTWPVQSAGNRGEDVRAIQSLLVDRGVSVSVTGYFGPATRDAVRTFQGKVGLTSTGVVNEATWKKLIRQLAHGSTGSAVRAVQRLLNEKSAASLPVTGFFGDLTKRAVAAFQRHMGLAETGKVDEATWRVLAWHYDLPRFTHLCDYSVGNGPANWGTGAAIGQLERAAELAYAAGHGRAALGDVSLEHGGDIRGHTSHEVGLDVDLRPMRKDGAQCSSGTNYRYASYSRAATRALIKAIRAAAPGHVKLIYFNDPVLISEGLVSAYPGHDNHLHIRYCEAGHPLAAYRCGQG
jgi:hypothetical protein